MSVRSSNHDKLVSSIETIRDLIDDSADESEKNRTLSKSVVDSFRKTRLSDFKAVVDLGGLEMDPLSQIEILESVAAIDGSTGWCLAIQGGISAIISGFLPDNAVPEVFRDGVPNVAGAVAALGEAHPIEGGFCVEGRWRFGSGIRHASWVLAGVRVSGADGPEAVRLVLVPSSQVTIHDNWHVAGLRGTGSCDFSIDNVRVPDHFTFPIIDVALGRPRRGGPLYQLGLPGLLAMEHAAIALGIGRHALDEITKQATSTLRGGLTPDTTATPLANRPSFQKDLGKSELQLRSARALVFDVYQEAWSEINRGEQPSPEMQTEMRCSAREATDVAANVTTMAYKYAGGGVLFDTNPIQRCFRDIHAASQHFVIADSAFEAFAQFKLGISTANPMA